MHLVVIALAVASAPEAPPPPRAATFACTRDTLLQDRPCTLEGRTPARAPSREQAQDNTRQGAVLANELCLSVARGDALDADPAVLSACRARVLPATRSCAGDGARGVTDDSGRFNPGFARCYAALAELVRAAEDDAAVSSRCCPCLAACGTSDAQCLERSARGQLGSCGEEKCQSACAASLLLRRALVPAAPPRKP